MTEKQSLGMNNGGYLIEVTIRTDWPSSTEKPSVELCERDPYGDVNIVELTVEQVEKAREYVAKHGVVK
jgi:hypothetical protein